MPGTIPFNQAAVSPPGSCPAHPEGPITAGSQLVSITTNPNAPSPSGSGNSRPAPTSAGSRPAPTSPTRSAASNVAIASSATSGFQLANGQAAQKLNAYFATLTPNSACTGMSLCSSNQLNISPLSFLQRVKTLASTTALPNALEENLSCNPVAPLPFALLFRSSTLWELRLPATPSRTLWRVFLILARVVA